MKKQFAVAAIAVALTLAGCSAAPAGNDAAVKTSSSSSTPSAAPVAAPTDNALVTKNETAGGDAQFIREVRIRVKGMDSVSDADLIAAGHYACDQFATGGTTTTIDSIKGVSDGDRTLDGKPGDITFNDVAVNTWAAKAYCPSYVG